MKWHEGSLGVEVRYRCEETWAPPPSEMGMLLVESEPSEGRLPGEMGLVTGKYPSRLGGACAAGSGSVKWVGS